ncbi:MAG: succinate dehydrogenase cytochrome b subunit [Ignavibacteriae bacterium]|nr:succinate dehydrogenase cytochrome b subunit [Ignavibacteriota bacterium]
MLGFLRSTILSKIVMTVSGAAIVGFLIAHLTGNLLIFGGPEKINAYGQGLRDLGLLLLFLRIGLVVTFVLHIVTSIYLADKNRTARPVSYTKKKSIQSTIASRTMFFSGLTILTFVVYHLLHFTYGIVQPEFYHGEYILHDGRTVPDIYSMMIHGFQNPFIVITYLLAVTFVCLHLSHAIGSAFQTLGINHTKYNGIIKKAGMGLATILWLGYMSIPFGIMAGVLKLTNGGH